MLGDADYRNIISAVRTPRFAVFIDEANPYWSTAVASLIRIFSLTWGGKYFMIVPTDGTRIKDKYWELLEAYSPDYLGIYSFTLADLEEANPGDYQAWADTWRKGWDFSQDFNEWFQEQKYLTRLGTFEIDASLDTELKNRLAPIHHADHAVQHWLVRNRAPSFPFTQVTDINLHAHRPTEHLVLPKATTDTDLKIMVLSQSGDLDQHGLDEYSKQGITATALPDEYRTEEFVKAVMSGSVDAVDLKLRQALAEQLPGDDEAWSPSENYVKDMPFQGSMLHLARYYAVGTHRDWEEPITAVIGDSIDDFCLYYCLSRLHDGVFWLPKKWLDECDRRRVNNLRLLRRGRPVRDPTETARVAQALIGLLYKSIGYGHDRKQVELRSMSLDADNLWRVLRLLGRLHWGISDELTKHLTIKAPSDTSTQCVARVIEENNYVNQQDMVFVDSKSVGRVTTPKPKNFSIIDPTNHRWMTSVQISGYTAPVLPFLGGQIALAHDSRVATDGIVYFCPGVAYFGGDIDVALTRPQLVILSVQEIMRQYFAEAGLQLKPSDKGNYLTDTIDRFGGLEAAAKFIGQRDTRSLLDLFLVKESAEDGHVVYLQPEGGRAFINYDGVRNCVGNDASQIIDMLVGKDILRRGLIFLCLRCRLSSWYDLAGLTAEFACRRCGLRQQFTKANWKSPEEPRWYYALAETVYQCYTHNSYLTILTLDYLRRQSKSSFDYLPEMDVINFPTEGRKHEIDVACLIDGRVVLGECKTETLKPNHTTKYQVLAKILPRLPDEMVFATSHPEVSQTFRDKTAGILGSRILTSRELMGVSVDDDGT